MKSLGVSSWNFRKFSTASHNLLIAKLFTNGVDSTALIYIDSYLKKGSNV